MPESTQRRYWKNRLSQQISGFHFNTCLSANNVQGEEEGEEEKTSAEAPVPLPATLSKKRLLWRKPLPNDCPVFDFNSPSSNNNSLDEKTEIPTRQQSKHYERIPNLEAELDRACKNEKALFLTNILSHQRH
ncbi:hypothetical protein INT47_010488 [Mucor saturninus]|uniref:Uncharacterized protein n=1 Tax=Mucor saturninus TaxID=64648 RepID=A0A8H7REH8_9FUNG|nr:hypothetical protein INT47_010488 [Mucor saturninus]